MQSHPFDILLLDNGAQLIFTPCPGTKDASLVDSISTLKQAGTDMLITLMFDEEMQKNNATPLPIECNKQEIEWLQLPILDDEAPTQAFETNWEKHKAEILAVINNKGTIAVHCKGGSGRTGLVIGLILLAMGWSGSRVITEIQKVRPKSLKNLSQLDYFNSYL